MDFRAKLNKGTLVGTVVYTGSGSLDERGSANIGYAYGCVVTVGPKQFSVRWEGSNKTKRYTSAHAITVLTDAESIQEAKKALR